MWTETALRWRWGSDDVDAAAAQQSNAQSDDDACVRTRDAHAPLVPSSPPLFLLLPLLSSSVATPRHSNVVFFTFEAGRASSPNFFYLAKEVYIARNKY